MTMILSDGHFLYLLAKAISVAKTTNKIRIRIIPIETGADMAIVTGIISPPYFKFF
jgi:Mg2+/citrate symporter